LLGVPLPHPSLTADPYRVLGVSPQASGTEIKAAYRALVKQHHPDAGGDATTILALNAAWEVLGDSERRAVFDRRSSVAGVGGGSPGGAGGPVGAGASAGRGTKVPRTKGSTAEHAALELWMASVYAPIDRNLGQVINPFAAQLKQLSADPYDDHLMELFCTYLEQSQQKMLKVEALYRSAMAPLLAKGFSLQLYHCFAQVKDALVDLERYTMGYVDSYLRDGRELMREAKRLRTALHQAKRAFG
jgi:molecular chaperone DnaJ